MTAVTTFPEWRGRQLDDVVACCTDLLENQQYPTVARWRAAGGKVAGHFQVYFPEEIAHAAGMLPFKVRGGQVEAMQADSRFGSYLCSIVKTSLELALSGRVTLDLFVTHPICDAARNLGAVWGRNFPYPCEILYLPQNANSAHAAEYLRGEYDRLRRTVERVAGRAVSDDDLRRSIAVFNQNRALLRALYALKREAPHQVRVDEAYVLVAVGGLETSLGDYWCAESKEWRIAHVHRCDRQGRGRRHGHGHRRHLARCQRRRPTRSVRGQLPEFRPELQALL